MKPKKLDCGIVSIIILVVTFIGICALGVVQGFRSKKVADPFVDMQTQAREICSRCSSGFLDASVDPYYRGKVLVVEARTGEVIGLTMADLSSEIRAAQPEEVSTLICAGDPVETQVGTYEDREAAYELNRDFCLYDLVDKRTILVETLHGGSPPPIKHEAGPKSSPDPARNELITFLNQLGTR
jgi:hypothetical protein